ncbi:unnamed protein product [Peronospora belbahrii]|uniref:Uncharacterized protein n=1 Tax=Peronospora belbahrii TaxID=622444 RepID=A0AAU9LC65_9STRA|nr:unnamed protein product [Peronospora belbahrii]
MKLSIVRNGVRDLLFGGHVTITLQSCFNDSYKYLEINFVYTAGATTVALLSIYLSSLSLLLMSLASKPILPSTFCVIDALSLLNEHDLVYNGLATLNASVILVRSGPYVSAVGKQDIFVAVIIIHPTKVAPKSRLRSHVLFFCSATNSSADTSEAMMLIA